MVRSFLPLALLFTLLLGLTACSAPAATTPAVAGPSPAPPAAASPAPASPVVVDQSCRSDADCTVKNVGNCCGYYPACVNVASATNPAAVQANCQAKGMMSVCGFPEISGCSCVKGKCESAGQGANPLRVPIETTPVEAPPAKR